MKRLIRRKSTGEFFQDGRWTRNAELATAFKSTGVLIQVGQAFHLKDVEIYLLMGETLSPRYDVTVPLILAPNL